MNIVKRTYNLVERGRSTNRPPSIPSGYPKYDRALYGIRQGTYILVGGETGTGKSHFIRGTYVENVYEHYKRINDPSVFDVQFIDFSLEIAAEMNLGNAMARKAFTDYQEVVPVSDLFSWGPLRLSDRHYELVKSFEDYYEDFHKKLSVIDNDTTPELFHNVLMEVAMSNGTFSTEAKHIKNCGVYTPNNPNKFTIVLLDTLNLADGTITKTTMDLISRTAVWFRNKCNFTFIIVQQFNSDIAATDRGRFGITTPILKDFMDSTRPTKDCTVALGLYAPYKHFKAENPMFKGYDVSLLGEWLISLHVMKNRYGTPNVCVPMKFDGAVGVFTELPPAPTMTTEEYFKATKH